MRTQSPDTSPQAEQHLIALIRQASLPRRWRLVQSLSQRTLCPDAGPDPRAEAIHVVTCAYGKAVGSLVARALAHVPAWHEEPVDLTAILAPMIRALEDCGIDCAIGGSLASSLWGMQQSALDLDLVLRTPLPSSQEVLLALQPLKDAYLLDEDALRLACSAGARGSLVHLGTLMKIDLISLPATPFEQAVAALTRRHLLDERYSPLPVASALEMVVYKLVRCAREGPMQSGKPLDDAQWNDLLGVLKVQGTDLDLQQVAYWAQILGVSRLLAQALDDAGLNFPHERASQAS